MLALGNLYGIASLLLAVNVGHDGAHASLARQAWINHVALYGSFMLIGADPYLWRMRHVRSHHVFPNVNGCDIDIDSNLFEFRPIETLVSAINISMPPSFSGSDIHGVHPDIHYRSNASWRTWWISASAQRLYRSSPANAPSRHRFWDSALLLPRPWWEVAAGAL
jgi:hypothetical protein